MKTSKRGVNKCRVRIAHADFQRGMKRVRSAHPTTIHMLRCGLGWPTGWPRARAIGPRLNGRLNAPTRYEAKWIPRLCGNERLALGHTKDEFAQRFYEHA